MWWKKFRLIFFSINYRHWSQIDQSLFEFFSAKLTTLPFTSPRYQFDEGKTFWQIFVCFIYHLRTLSKTIKAFFGKQSAALSKWLTTCPRRFFAENFFFKKVLFLFQHWALSERFLSFRRKFVGPVVSTAFCLSIRPVCGEQNFCQKFFSHHFWTFIQKLIVFVRIFFSAKLTTLLSTSPKDHFEVITLFWQSFCLFFQWFLESERRNNGFFSSKNNRQICHNCLPRVQEDFVKIFFWKSSFFHHWALSGFCMSFQRKFVGPLSVLLSVCQFGQFVVKKISSNFFPHYFRTSIANWSVFVRIFFRPNGRHCFLRVRRITLKTNICFEIFLYVFSSFSNIERKIKRFFLSENK